MVEAKVFAAGALVTMQTTPAQGTLAERLACRGVADAAMEAWKIKADVGETALAALASESRRADAALCETLLVLGGDAGGAMQAATA